ncbi:hypothetical protein AG1IA_02377 [Rhizoctonia solani AG-1 IA]|uniref:Uncharacterized protein n=1 Tax=Thanatephorus cucumeris (strain AG1-IA) TaxID=983506 RepID=L8X049_THACA|nr:hypothetical protein AG1IA_02377 [Rhizoctonia solani AG-1 IA]
MVLKDLGRLTHKTRHLYSGVRTGIQTRVRRLPMPLSGEVVQGIVRQYLIALRRPIRFPLAYSNINLGKLRWCEYIN